MAKVEREGYQSRINAIPRREMLASGAQKIGSAETVAEFFRRCAAGADPLQFLEVLRSAPDRASDPEDDLEQA